MPGGEQKQPWGYTIVEVMVVLAVSSVMFLIAASFINGRQEEDGFREGVYEMASNIQSIIEQVNDGNFSDQNVNCKDNVLNSLGYPLTISNIPSNGQGTNNGCVFFGKLLKFTPNLNVTNYKVYTLAGCQSDLNCGTTPSLYKTEGIMAVAPPAASGVDLTVLQNTPQSLYINDITIYPVPPPPTGTPSPTTVANNLAFVQTLGSSNSYQNGTYTSGASSVELEYAIGTSKKGDISTTDDIYKDGMNIAQAAKICVTDSQRYAEIDLGDPSGKGGSKLNVSVIMDKTC